MCAVSGLISTPPTRPVRDGPQCGGASGAGHAITGYRAVRAQRTRVLVRTALGRTWLRDESAGRAAWFGYAHPVTSRVCKRAEACVVICSANSQRSPRSFGGGLLAAHLIEATQLPKYLSGPWLMNA